MGLRWSDIHGFHNSIPINHREHVQLAHRKLTTCILGDKINLHRSALVCQPLTFLGIEQRRELFKYLDMVVVEPFDLMGWKH